MSLPFSSKPKSDKDMGDYQGTVIHPLEVRGKITPDFHVLKWFPRIPYFAIGNEKDNAPNHYCIQNAEYLGKAHSMTPHFILKSHLNLYPVLFKAGNHEVVRQHIRGELYHVNVEMIHLLDVAFDRGLKCERIKIKVQLEDQTPDNAKYFRNLPWTDALIYVALPDYWDDKELNTRQSFMIQDNKALREKSFFEWTPYTMRERMMFQKEKKEREMLLRTGTSDKHLEMSRMIREAQEARDDRDLIDSIGHNWGEYPSCH